MPLLPRSRVDEGMKRTTLFGPPGSGKTTTLSKWAKQAAEKYGGENVMICSLTKTAAAEIQSRSTGVPRENVGTLHAHCYRAVGAKYEGKWKVISKDDITEWNAGKTGIYQIPVQASAEEMQQTFTDSLITACDLFRARMIALDKWPVKHQRFWNLYYDFKQQRTLIDFTDMIEIALNEIDCPMDYIILDEAQDCSALEFALLSKWASQCKGVVIAGDDDQSAYEWRGASVDAFLNFAEDQRVLPRTYRMPSKIKEYSESWISQIRNRKEKKYEPRVEGGQVSELDTRSVEDLIDLSMSLEGSSMILTTCSYMLNPILKELTERAIPFHNPYRTTGDYASSWNPLAAGSRGSSTAADAVRSLLSPPWTYKDIYLILREMSTDYLAHGAKAASQRMKSQDGYVGMDQLSLWLGDSNLTTILAGDLNWWMSTIKDSKRRGLLSYRVRVGMKHGLTGLTTTPRIIVGTIHSVKGGEADNVFLFPDLSRSGHNSFLENEDPIIRQLYIGITRARERLYLVPAPRHGVVQW